MVKLPGSPKRKMHRTLPSEFKMLRPRTRDLLLLPAQDRSDGKETVASTHKSSQKRSSPKRTRRGISSLVLLNPGTVSKSDKTRKPVVLPKLATKPVKETRNQIGTKENLQLPQIK